MDKRTLLEIYKEVIAESQRQKEENEKYETWKRGFESNAYLMRYINERLDDFQRENDHVVSDPPREVPRGRW